MDKLNEKTRLQQACELLRHVSLGYAGYILPVIGHEYGHAAAVKMVGGKVFTHVFPFGTIQTPGIKEFSKSRGCFWGFDHIEDLNKTKSLINTQIEAINSINKMRRSTVFRKFFGLTKEDITEIRLKISKEARKFFHAKNQLNSLETGLTCSPAERVAIFAAGPLGGMLSCYGLLFAGNIHTECKKDKDFKTALYDAWRRPLFNLDQNVSFQLTAFISLLTQLVNFVPDNENVDGYKILRNMGVSNPTRFTKWVGVPGIFCAGFYSILLHSLYRNFTYEESAKKEKIEWNGAKSDWQTDSGRSNTSEYYKQVC